MTDKDTIATLQTALDVALDIALDVLEKGYKLPAAERVEIKKDLRLLKQYARYVTSGEGRA